MLNEKNVVVKASLEAIMSDVGQVPEAEKTFISYVFNCQKELLNHAWGEIETARFLDFLAHIDFLHPDTNGILTAEEKRILLNAIKVQNFCNIEGCELSDNISKLVSSEIKFKLKKFGNPMENRCQVRMLVYPEDRKTARAYKAIRPVEMNSLLKKGESFLGNHPNSFLLYARNQDMFSGEIVKAEKKAEHYKKLGCLSLHDEIIKSLETFQKQLSEDYVGFHRISLTSAAIILAKVHDIDLMGNFPSNVIRFDPKHQVYKPHIYPWHCVEDHASEQMKKIIRRLDAFPACYGKAIFDHLLVLVPSIYFKANLPEDIKKIEEIDWAYVRVGDFHPIVLGERDGKCYFITYWH